MRRSAIGLALAALLLAGCGGGSKGLEGFNVLLVTLDTTRQDRVGCYGYAPGETPRLDALAAAGTVFENALTQCPVTLPAHTTMMTGNLPSYHGVRGNGAYRLPEEQDTLAEILRRNGYATGAVVASAVLEGRYGLDQGFDTYDDDQGKAPSDFHYPERRAAVITERALEIAEGLPAARPFFLWTHYFDPHGRYEPPPAFAKRFPTTDSGKYDGEIASMDAAIGDLLDGLDRLGRLDRTLIVVVADHGEGFPGPHGEETHGMLLYRDTLEIPLVVHAPGVLPESRRVSALVSTVDVAPTVLDLLGIDTDVPHQGRSLAPWLRAEKLHAGKPGSEEPGAEPSTEERHVYAETAAPYDFYGWSPLYQLRDRRWKLVWGARTELFDLDADPDQLENVADRHPDVVETMQQRIRDIRAERHPSASRAEIGVSAEESRRLEAIGYLVKGGAVPEPDESAELGDPAELIRLQVPLDDARQLGISGRPAQAASKIRNDVLSVDPGNLEGWSLLARFSIEADDLTGAVSALERLVQERPASAPYRARLADAYMRQARAFQGRGQVALARAKKSEGIAAYEESIRLDGEALGPVVNLAAIYLQERRPEDAEPLLRRAIEIDSESFEAHQNLGALLLMTGRTDEAGEFVQRALDIAPDEGRKRAAQKLLERFRHATASERDD